MQKVSRISIASKKGSVVLLVSLIAAFVLGSAGVFVYDKNKFFGDDRSRQEDGSLSDDGEVPGVGDEVVWNTYENDKIGFEFRYPSILDLEEKEDGSFVLSHEVPFRHGNPCDLKEGAEIPNITDFYMEGREYKGSAADAIRAEKYYGVKFDASGKPVIEEFGIIKKTKWGSVDGYVVSMGVEGCGTNVYYIPINENKTLVVNDHWVGEFSEGPAFTSEYRKIPGIITPEARELYWKAIFSSFVTKFGFSPGGDDISDSVPSCETNPSHICNRIAYTNDTIGLTFLYPRNWGEPVEFSAANSAGSFTDIKFTKDGSDIGFKVHYTHFRNLIRKVTFDEFVGREVEVLENYTISKEDTVLAEKTAVKITYTDPVSGGNATKVYVAINDNDFLIISYDMKVSEYLDFILSTFSFK